MPLTYLCATCATQYPPGDEPPTHCPICEDERQYVPHDTGQVWTAYDEFLAGHRAELRDDHGILGIGCEPSFAIGQRALLVEAAAGNVLWDCIPYLDDELAESIRARGGLAGIAISHPHYYSAMVEWAHAFGCPIHLNEAERRWVMRPDPAIRFWSGERLELAAGLTRSAPRSRRSSSTRSTVRGGAASSSATARRSCAARSSATSAP